MTDVEKVLSGAKKHGVTEEQLESIRKMTEHMDKRKKERAIKKPAVLADLKAFLEKHYPDRKRICDPYDIHEAVAALLDMYREDSLAIDELYVKWTMSHFMHTRIQKNLPRMLKIHGELVKRGHCGKENEFVFNDCDNSAFYLKGKDEETKIFALTSQNFNFLYFIEPDHYHDFEVDNNRIKIYRYWDQWNWDDWDYNKFKDDFMNKAIEYAGWIKQHCSDHVEGYKYIQRPDLKWFEERELDPEKIDSTENVFIDPVYPMHHNNTSDSMIYFFGDIAYCVQELYWTACALWGREV